MAQASRVELVAGGLRGEKRKREKEMIRNVILMATSGLVLFSKEFVNSVAQV